MLNVQCCVSSVPLNYVINLFPTTQVSTITSSCSSSESSSLTTGLALVRPVRLLRPFPRSPPLSFLPRRIFTFTERAGDNQTHKPTHVYGMFMVSVRLKSSKAETALMTMRGETSLRKHVQLPRIQHLALPWPGWLRTINISSTYDWVAFPSATLLTQTCTYFRTLILPPARLPLPHSPLPHFPPPSRSFASNWWTLTGVRWSLHISAQIKEIW